MSKDKVRLSVDCSPEERQSIRVLCNISGDTISEWVMCAVRKRITEESEHLPNKRKPNGFKSYSSIDEYFEDNDIETYKEILAGNISAFCTLRFSKEYDPYTKYPYHNFKTKDPTNV